MTVSELHTAFRLELDKTNSLSTTSFEPEEIDYWLNKAYLALVNQKMFGTNPRGEGFDMSQKREDDLRLLINTAITPVVLSSTSNDFSVQISTNFPNYLYFISSFTTFNNQTKVVNYNISHLDKDKFIETCVNIPWIKNPAVYIHSDYITVFYDKYEATISGIIPTFLTSLYLRKPETLTIVSANHVPLIAEHVHPEIASLAAFMAIENIESPRVQTNPLILNKLE